MKNTLIAILAFLPVVFLNAQKTDKESIGFMKYVQYPSQPLSKEFKTYKVDARHMAEEPNVYVEDDIRSNCKLQGYKKIGTDEEADLTLYVEAFPLQLGESSRSSDTEVKKNKDGSEKRTTYHTYSNTIKFRYKYALKDKYNEVIDEGVLQGNQKFSGNKSANVKSAYSSYKSAISKEKSKLSKSQYNAINNKLNQKYGFPIQSMNMYAFKIKPKKFDYDEFNASYDAIKKATDLRKESLKDTLSNTAALDQYEEDLKKAIQTYQKEIEQLEPDNKKARVNTNVAAAAYYNIAIAHFLMDEYTQAQDALAKGRELEKGIGLANIMENLYADMNARKNAYNQSLL